MSDWEDMIDSDVEDAEVGGDVEVAHEELVIEKKVHKVEVDPNIVHVILIIILEQTWRREACKGIQS